MISVRTSVSINLVFGSMLLAPSLGFAQLPGQQPCPRVDIIQLNSELSAVNLDGYTLGHVRAPEIADEFRAQRPNARVISIKPSIPSEPATPLEPRGPGLPHCPNIVFSTENKTLNLGDEIIASFKTFTPTREILQQVREREKFVVGRRIQFEFPQPGNIAAMVKSGPDRPQPDAGGGGTSERPIPRRLPGPGRPDTRP